MDVMHLKALGQRIVLPQNGRGFHSRNDDKIFPVQLFPVVRIHIMIADSQKAVTVFHKQLHRLLGRQAAVGIHRMAVEISLVPVSLFFKPAVFSHSAPLIAARTGRCVF